MKTDKESKCYNSLVKTNTDTVAYRSSDSRIAFKRKGKQYESQQNPRICQNKF